MLVDTTVTEEKKLLVHKIRNDLHPDPTESPFLILNDEETLPALGDLLGLLNKLLVGLNVGLAGGGILSSIVIECAPGVLILKKVSMLLGSCGGILSGLHLIR